MSPCETLSFLVFDKKVQWVQYMDTLDDFIRLILPHALAHRFRTIYLYTSLM